MGMFPTLCDRWGKMGWSYLNGTQLPLFCLIQTLKLDASVSMTALKQYPITVKQLGGVPKVGVMGN